MTTTTSYLQEQAERVSIHLATLLSENDTHHALLFEAARYSLLGSGKRLRPVLCLAATEALGGNTDHALDPACALEMIHTYSLIHDDLPCMDDDDFRRGIPTLHKVYNDAHAVLTGDFLLTHAFGVVAAAPHLTAEKKVAITACLAKRAGGDGMVAGQILDIAYTGKKVSLTTLENIHLHKTAALITAAIECGGIVSSATPEQLLLLRAIGRDLGLAFQIVDDIIDVTASEAKHGRTTSSDADNDKLTYVALLGVEGSQKAAQRLLEAVHKRLQQLGTSGDITHLATIADLCVKRAL